MLQTVYYDPFRVFNSDSRSSKIRHSKTHAKDNYWRPEVDIIETENQYQLMLDLPGIDPQNIEVTEEKNVLTIKAERSVLEAKEGQKVTRTERKSGAYQRQFTLPQDADVESISAESQNGVLQLLVKRKQPQDTLRKIKVTR